MAGDTFVMMMGEEGDMPGRAMGSREKGAPRAFAHRCAFSWLSWFALYLLLFGLDVTTCFLLLLW